MIIRFIFWPKIKYALAYFSELSFFIYSHDHISNHCFVQYYATSLQTAALLNISASVVAHPSDITSPLAAEWNLIGGKADLAFANRKYYIGDFPSKRPPDESQKQI